MSNSHPNTSSNKEIEKWLSEIKELYGAKRVDQFKEEEDLLKAFLLKLKEETQPSRRLSICRLESPYRRGGTGIIFKALHTNVPEQELVLKFNRPRLTGDTRALVENELRILPLLDHANIIRVIDVGKFNIKVEGNMYPLCFIVEPYIPEAMTLRDYVETLSYKDMQDINTAFLDLSLQRLTFILHQWVDALVYIHERGYVYLDVKPDNAIVDKDGHLLVIDFGSAQEVDPTDNSPIEIYITKRYADPRIKKEISRSTSPDRVRSAVKRKDLTPDLDYYALGKSILEILYIISKDHPHDFPQRPLFQSLHFLATRLLNGKNEERATSLTEHRLSETFRGLRRPDYETIRYTDLKDVLRDLEKERGSWNPEKVIPELATYAKETVRVVPGINTVLTPRLLSLIEHPLLARLKMVTQLGLITLVYPTASHSRYDHVLGSYTYTTSYIKSLFNDTHNCIFRNLVNEDDIKAALLASIVHDLGQYPLAHDLQDVHPKIFDHTGISIDLLSNQTKDRQGRTLLDIIQDPKDGWGVDPERLKRILGAHSGQLRLLGIDVRDFKADMLSALIDGPIDADKADYIIRDSTSCRIPYGKQLDIERLLRVLTTVRIPEYLQASHKVTIGVYEKGRASASAFSLARYLMYSSVYWHHTARIIKAMLHYATAMILPPEVFYTSTSGKIREVREKLIHFVLNLTPPFEEIEKGILSARSFFDVDKLPVKGEPPSDVLKTIVEGKMVSKSIEEHEKVWYPGISTTDWLMLNWLKTLSKSKEDVRGIALIDMIQQRKLYKRVYTIQIDNANKELVTKLEALKWLDRIKLCENMQGFIYETIEERKDDLETKPLTHIDDVRRLFTSNLLVLVDIPDPEKYAGTGRPLIYVPELERKTYYQNGILPVRADNLVRALEFLMKSISPVRVLCHPDIRQWIGACFRPNDMREIINRALDKV